MAIRFAGASAQTGVVGAIANAALATGVDFGYLLGQAQAESAMDPAARARGSSAAGLFQFIDQTWLSVLKQHGAKHGLGWAADAVHWVGGNLGVADAATRSAIMALKRDPTVSALLAGEYAADNKAGLEARLGRTVGAAELHLAHFLGLSGATRFLRALATRPSAPAAETTPHAAHANHAVFYTRGGTERSLAEVYEGIAAKVRADRPAPHVAPTVLVAPPVGQAYARAARLLLAELGA